MLLLFYRPINIYSKNVGQNMLAYKQAQQSFFRKHAIKVLPKSCGTSFLPLCSAPLCIE